MPLFTIVFRKNQTSSKNHKYLRVLTSSLQFKPSSKSFIKNHSSKHKYLSQLLFFPLSRTNTIMLNAFRPPGSFTGSQGGVIEGRIEELAEKLGGPPWRQCMFSPQLMSSERQKIWEEANFHSIVHVSLL
jgi:hypothetical protein